MLKVVFFFCWYSKSTSKIGETVSLKFIVTQHTRDLLLLKSFINSFVFLFFGGDQLAMAAPQENIIIRKSLAGDFKVTKFNDILYIIIPFFDKYPLIGSKYLYFLDFKQVAQLMESKSAQTEEGLKKKKY